MASRSTSVRIVVIGLGYVGLPLAVALAKTFDVTGFDVDSGRIDELRAGRDLTGEIDPAALERESARADRPGRGLRRRGYLHRDGSDPG